MFILLDWKHNNDGNGQELMLDGRDSCKDLALFKPIRADALTGHPRAALATQPLSPGTLGMVLAHPTQAETNGTFWVDHETRRMGCWR